VAAKRNADRTICLLAQWFLGPVSAFGSWHAKGAIVIPLCYDLGRVIGGPIMAALDWSRCAAVESIPGKVGGAWVFRGTRLPVATVIENLEDLSIEDVMEQFEVSREQIASVLEFVAESLRVPALADAHPV
jgi:uncharacterized protein (DUF433 family)